MLDLIFRLFSTSQPLLAMRRAPEYRKWVAQVRALADQPELACIRDLLLTLASNQLETLDPLNEFAQSHAGSIAYADIWVTSERIEQAIPEQPEAALLASIVILLLWLVRLDDQLYAQVNGMPARGWAQFPFVCAKAALASGAVDEALSLIDEGLEVLGSAKYRYGDFYDATVARYRQLGVAVETRWRQGFEDLASDLRESCRQEQPNFRAETGALLWSLGMIPEGSMFLFGAAFETLPPLRLCRLIINVSNIGMAQDPLTQYIWLEMKDREPFNIRDHPVFFGTANLRYANHLLDEVMPEPPSCLFAKTLIAWFRGDLDEQLAGEYVQAYRLVEAEFPSSVAWPIYFRMRLLAFMVGERFGWLRVQTPAESLQTAQEMVDQAASVNLNTFSHPEWPELYTRTSGPIFSLLDKLAGGSAPGADCVSILERFRAASLGYWLTIAAPLPSLAEEAAAAALIAQEKQLLTELQGAYFMMLAPILPMHYRRAAQQIDPDDPTSLRYPDMSKGPENYKRIQGELADLYAQMQSVAPEYARRRTAPIADVAGIAGTLGMHRSGGASSSAA
jgi:hypothetical protein